MQRGRGFKTRLRCFSFGIKASCLEVFRCQEEVYCSVLAFRYPPLMNLIAIIKVKNLTMSNQSSLFKVKDSLFYVDEFPAFFQNSLLSTVLKK